MSDSYRKPLDQKPSPPSFWADRIAQFQQMTSGSAAQRQTAKPAEESRVYTFNGMTPASASRRLERVFATRDMVATARSTSNAIPHLQPVDIVIPQKPKPDGSKPDDSMPQIQSDIPPGSHVEPAYPDESGNQTLPHRWEQDSGNSMGGGGGGTSGGNNQNAPGDSGGGGQNGSAPPPTQRETINPPGHHVIWDNDHPHWEDGREVHVYRDENGNVTGYGYPEPVPGTVDDAPAENKPARDHSDSGQQPKPSTSGNGGGSTKAPSDADNQGSRPTTNNTAPDPAEPDDSEQQQDTAPTADASENENSDPSDPAAPTESEPEPQPKEQDDLPPETNQEDPQPQSEEPEEEHGIGQPGFWEGMIPVWGSARSSIDDFQNGRWVMGTINAILAITDLLGVGALAKAGGKLLFKLGKSLLESAAVKKAIADAAAAAAKKIADSAKAVIDGVKSAWNKAGEMIGGIFGGGKKKAAEEAERAKKAAAEEADRRAATEEVERQKQAAREAGKRKAEEAEVEKNKDSPPPKKEESWKGGDDIPGPAKGKDLKYPNRRRHDMSQMRKGRADEKNTVIPPETAQAVREDIAKIAEGKAEFDGKTGAYTVNGRSYGVEANGRVYPMSGPGLIEMSRTEYRALQDIINSNGDMVRLEKIFGNAPQYRDNLDAVLKAWELYREYFK
ncbi:hypothetical protein [Nocardia sp. NPDC051570]|uniref:hypothetical protein n=1 Tax=Nocardia sp. NPDC051570 TaxID=3364324 RepID=UPI00378BE04B